MLTYKRCPVLGPDLNLIGQEQLPGIGDNIRYFGVFDIAPVISKLELAAFTEVPDIVDRAYADSSLYSPVFQLSLGMLSGKLQDVFL